MIKKWRLIFEVADLYDAQLTTADMREALKRILPHIEAEGLSVQDYWEEEVSE